MKADNFTSDRKTQKEHWNNKDSKIFILDSLKNSDLLGKGPETGLNSIIPQHNNSIV